MIRFSTGLRNAVVGTDSMGSAMNHGAIYVYDGAIPATPDDPPTGTLLGMITEGGKTYYAGSDTESAGLGLLVVPPGGLMNNAPWRLKGVANGDATWFRWCSRGVDTFGASTTLRRVDGLVGESLRLSGTTVLATTNVEIESFLFLLPTS
jgi:hypothetical protein